MGESRKLGGGGGGGGGGGRDVFLVNNVCLFVCLFCCFTSQVNSYGHCGTVSSPNHSQQCISQMAE